jgi:hypothetical protein
MIYFGDTELYGVKIGNTDISAIYAGDLLIWPTSVTGWSVSPAEFEMEASGGTENIRITSLSAWTITSSESWITFSQNSGDSGRTTVEAIIAENEGDLDRTATITVTDGTNVSTIAVTQEMANPYANMYLTIKITGAGTLKWYCANNSYKKIISYSKDNGQTWTNVTPTSASSGTNISVTVGDVIIFKGTNSTYSNNSSNTNNCFRYSTCRFTVEGNVMSLIYGDDFKGKDSFAAGTSYNLSRLFQNCTGLTDASNLVFPATAVTVGCYRSVFDTASSMTGAPELPATMLANECYYNMFLRCSSMTTAPVLPAATLYASSYEAMFYSCTRLNYIKCLATDISASRATTNFTTSVASSGTFVKAASMTSWPRGNNGIPSRWTVVDNS